MSWQPFLLHVCTLSSRTLLGCYWQVPRRALLSYRLCKLCSLKSSCTTSVSTGCRKTQVPNLYQTVRTSLPCSFFKPITLVQTSPKTLPPQQSNPHQLSESRSKPNDISNRTHPLQCNPDCHFLNLFRTLFHRPLAIRSHLLPPPNKPQLLPTDFIKREHIMHTTLSLGSSSPGLEPDSSCSKHGSGRG